MSEKPIKSVGLGGDGDEIIAIVDVESAFGVKLDYADAPHWRTAAGSDQPRTVVLVPRGRRSIR